MRAEQIPGSLFVLLLAAIGLDNGWYDLVLLNALGCAFGWQTFSLNQRVEFVARAGSLLCWTIVFIALAWRLL